MKSKKSISIFSGGKNHSKNQFFLVEKIIRRINFFWWKKIMREH